MKIDSGLAQKFGRLVLGLALLSPVGFQALADGHHEACYTPTESVVCQFKSVSRLTDLQWTIEKGVNSSMCTGARDVNVSEVIVRSGGASFSLHAPQHLSEYQTNYDNFFQSGHLTSKQFLSANPDFGQNARFHLALALSGEIITGTADIHFALNEETARSDVYQQIQNIDAASEKDVTVSGTVVCSKILH